MDVLASQNSSCACRVGLEVGVRHEWKTAKASSLRERFYLYLVGNLRSDLPAAQPYIRTIRNPFKQIAADVQVLRTTQRKVQLTVAEFREAEHLDLTVKRTHEGTLSNSVIRSAKPN
jgi:hypothetical protein